MTRAWIAVALLAGSLLFARAYLDPARPIVAAAVALVSVLLLARAEPLGQGHHGGAAGRSVFDPVDDPRSLRGRSRSLWISLALLLPALRWLPWPAKWVPVLLAAAILIAMSGLRPAWTRRLARALTAAALLLLFQGLALTLYAYETARAHELPRWMAELVALVPRWLGAETTLDGSAIVVRGAHGVYRIAATWELLFDPAGVLFLVGGIVLLAWRYGLSPETGCGWSAWWQATRRLLLIMLAWWPLRAGLLIAIVLHRALRADGLTEPNVGSVLVYGWIHLGLLIGPVSLASWLVPRAPVESSREASGGTASDSRDSKWFVAYIAGGIGLLMFVACWSPVGKRKPGTITFVERHSTWEPTQVPYGTTVYGEAGSYNYAAAYAYCEQYFPMARLLEEDSIDDASLADCSVLIIKTPTARYTSEEVDAVQRFVQRGGSLLLIGDHTNVFNMNTYLNDIGRRFGCTFRNDLLFRVGDPYRQKDRRPWPAHPAVQHLPPIDFAVSCSIDPGRHWGSMVVRNEGLYSLPPAYHESNYHPQAEYRSDMQYGSWCQMWTSTFGRGRVLAFADSTLFSNFCVFQPGKAELLRGMLNWLHRTSVWDRAVYRRLLQIPLLLVGIAWTVWGLYTLRQGDGGGLLAVCAALGSGTLVASALQAWQSQAIPIPPRERPLPCVVIDRHLSQVPLFAGAFAEDKEGLGYGMLEQWIPRIGNVIARSTDPRPFFGDGLVVICPTVSVTDEYRNAMMQFVEEGGRLLVIDSPEVTDSTANSLLAPFGMLSLRERAEQLRGELRWAERETPQPLELLMSCEIQGGQPLARVGSIPAAAQVRYGQGLVTALGFGSLFNDAAMGFHWLPEPDQATRQRYAVLYDLLRVALPGENAVVGGATD